MMPEICGNKTIYIRTLMMLYRLVTLLHFSIEYENSMKLHAYGFTHNLVNRPLEATLHNLLT